MRDKLLEAFERLSLDSKLSFFIESDRGDAVRVQFDRSGPRQWALWFADHPEETKRNVSRNKLTEVLQAMGTSPHKLESEVSAHLLLQCAFCDQLIRESKELLGEAAVQGAIYDTQKMMDDLTEAVTKTLGPSEITGQTLEQTQGHSAKDLLTRENLKNSPRTNLRVIKDR